jgi:hypothetical protein
MNAESNQYTHGFCLNCNKIRPVRFSRIGNDEHAPTNVVCNDCNFIIASLYKRPRVEPNDESQSGSALPDQAVLDRPPQIPRPKLDESADAADTNVVVNSPRARALLHPLLSAPTGTPN